MILRPAFLALFLLMLAAPAFAQDAAPDTGTAAPAAAASADDKAASTEENAADDTSAADELIKNAPENANPPQDVDLPPMTPPPAATMENMPIVVLRTIDKLSARTHTFDLPVDKTVKFGNSLFIKARACRKSSPLSQPESAAFLQIWERRPKEDESHWIFSGWMFSSNPSLSAMDHPVYDVWVIECKNNATSSKEEKFSSENLPDKKPEEDAKPSPDSKQGGDAADTPVPETSD